MCLHWQETEIWIRSVAYSRYLTYEYLWIQRFRTIDGNYFSPFDQHSGYVYRFDQCYLQPVAMVKSAKNIIISNYSALPSTVRPCSSKWVATFDVQFDINNNKTSSFLPQVATGQAFTSSFVNCGDRWRCWWFCSNYQINLDLYPKIKNTKHDFTSLGIDTSDVKSVWQRSYVTNTASSGWLGSILKPSSLDYFSISLWSFSKRVM